MTERGEGSTPALSTDRDEEIVQRYLVAVVGGDTEGRPRSSRVVQERLPVEAAELEASFVACARRWADRNGVRRQTFARFGVPSTVLDVAWSQAPSGHRRLPMHSQIRVLYPPGKFTIREAAEYCGLSPTTISRALERDLRAGHVQRVEMLDRRGPGTRPWLYQALASPRTSQMAPETSGDATT